MYAVVITAPDTVTLTGLPSEARAAAAIWFRTPTQI